MVRFTLLILLTRYLSLIGCLNLGVPLSVSAENQPNVDVAGPTQGFLKVVLTSAYSSDQNLHPLLTKSPTAIKVCSASKFSDFWTFNICLYADPAFEMVSGEQQKKVWRYHEISLPLQSHKPSTHLVAMIGSSEDDVVTADDVTYSFALPATFNKNDVIPHISLEAIDGSSDTLLSSSISILCSPNHYGSRCMAFCVPPTTRHQCDDVTGELKCAGTLMGKNCDENIFQNRGKASQFIKQRSKRANSWHSFEETRSGDIERECEEEICDREEAREAFEDDVLTEMYWRNYTDPNQCLPNPCHTSNTRFCEDLYQNYICHCLPGYGGRNCQLYETTTPFDTTVEPIVTTEDPIQSALQRFVEYFQRLVDIARQHFIQQMG